MSAHKTLIFHIGDHKTGSTSIQYAFAEGRISLDRKTLLYPAELASNVLKRRFLAWDRAETETEKQKAATPLQALADRIRASEADYVVISAEEFERVPPKVFKQIVDLFFADTADQIRVIAYVRPHAPRIVSSFCECTKIGAPRALRQTIGEFAEMRRETGSFDYFPRFNLWRELYGDNFLLRPMIRSQLRAGSVVTDFIEHAFPDEPYTLRGDDDSNESLELTDLMRLKVLQLNLMDKKPPLRHQIGWEYLRQVSQQPPGPDRQKLRMHRGLAKEIRDIYLEDARSIDRAFFDGQPLLENELHAAVRSGPRRAQSVDPADYLSAAEIHSLRVMAGFLSNMLDMEDVNWTSFFHQTRVSLAVETRKANLAAV
ncbi:hypothetical protein GFB49_14155 [Epibacterium sp. SM1979]|uniref:Sulfotransferase domain-containing protein n=1 Tax=Tritonibacter litoralis TaxID=2662264 RepID=A0A843YLR1_9RHOB|nr:hypothetical protein [Tritonibacter litoralis]MQQ09607.1 hypothetical protein [Tritonibacter litoralis]